MSADTGTTLWVQADVQAAIDAMSDALDSARALSEYAPGGRLAIMADDLAAEEFGLCIVLKSIDAVAAALPAARATVAAAIESRYADTAE